MSRVTLFDIGNTALKAASFDGRQISDPASCLYDRMTPRKLAQVCRGYAKPELPDAAIACCVSPAQGAKVREAWKSVSSVPLVFVNHKMKMPIGLKKYPLPASIGTDRLACASASYSIVKDEHIVISVGTALTCDCVDSRGLFLGGSIGAGPNLMLEYLAARTGQLPRIDFSGSVPAIGRSTEGAMRIGARVGFACMLNGILEHLESGAFKGRHVPLILTGGYAKTAVRILSRKSRVIPDLSLRGLSIIYGMNF